MDKRENNKKIFLFGMLIILSFVINFGIVLAEGGYGDSTGIGNVLDNTTIPPADTGPNSGTSYPPANSVPIYDPNGSTGPNSGSGYPNDDAYAPAGSGSGTSTSGGSTGGSSWFNVFMGTSGGGSGFGSYNSSGGSGGNGGINNGSFYNPNFIGNTNTTSNPVTINLAPMKINLPSGTCSKITDVGSLFKFVTCTVVNSVIPLIVVLSITVFLWGIAMFMMNSADPTKRKEGKQFMLWGIIALFIIVSYWGIVKMFGDTLGFSGVKAPQLQDDIYPQL